MTTDGDDPDDTLPLVKVDGPDLICPHCGTSGLDNFVYIEDIQNFRDLKRIEDGLLTIESYYQVADDGENPRLGCKKCDKECLIPEDLQYDWE